MLIQLSKALVGVAFQTLPDRWPNTVVSSIHSLKKACETVEVCLDGWSLGSLGGEL